MSGQRYSLRMFAPVLQGNIFIADITALAQGWARSIRAQGGYWQGSFTINADVPTCEWFFYESLGNHLEERSGGGVTWEGMIYEVELLTNGLRQRRSLSLMGNSIKARYTDAADDVVKAIGYSNNLISQSKYGLRQEAITLGKVSTAAATAHRDTTLKELAFPWPRPVSMSLAKGAASISITVCGYVFTTNWKFVSVQDGATGNVSTYVNDIIGTDCQFVSVGVVKPNTLQVARKTALDARAWDQLSTLTNQGDASANPWRLYVRQGRKAYYEPVNPVPVYYRRGGALVDNSGNDLTSNPWAVQPGVVRYAQYPNTRVESGSFLADSRDIWIDEVSVDGTGAISLNTALYDEAAILEAQERERDRERQQT